MRPLQPQFKIRIYKLGVRPGVNDSYMSKGSSYRADDDYTYMDIEECVAWGVVYSEEASLMNTLSFTVDKFADILLQRFFIGQWVVLYGGYYDENGKGVRKVFSGTVTRIRTQFADSGRVSFRVECMSYGFTKMGKDNQYYTYPDKNSERNFAKGKEEISLQELIEGIGKESGMQIGKIQLPKEAASLVFTETNMRRQKGMSDWKFLYELSKAYNCFMWTEYIEGKETLHFVDNTKATKVSNQDISFLFPLMGSDGVKDIRSEEMQRFPDAKWNRPRLLRSVSLDEDIAMAGSISRTAVYIDKETGEQKSAVAEILTDDEGRKVTVFYELDEAKVAEVDRTNPKLADQIRSMGGGTKGWSSGAEDPSQETPEYTRYYYKEIKRYFDGDVAVNDNAFFGITVNAVCNMDLDIRSQRSYSIRGILRYNSTNKSEKYMLLGLKHIWSENGNTTELNFMK